MYNKRYIQQLYGVFLLGTVCVFCTSSVQAEEVIQNVTLYSSSNNQKESANLKVKTIINGKVVEDYEETSDTGDITYRSKINGNGTIETTAVSTSASDESTYKTLADLLVLLQQLTELLNQNSLEI